MQVLNQPIVTDVVLQQQFNPGKRRFFVCITLILMVLLILDHYGYLHFDELSSHIPSLYLSNENYLGGIESRLLSDLAQMNTLSTMLNSGLSEHSSTIDIKLNSIYQEMISILDKGEGYILSAIAIVGGLQIISYVCEWLAPYLMTFLLVYLTCWSFICTFSTHLIYQATLQWLFKLLCGVLLFGYLVVPYTLHVSSMVTHELEHQFHHKIDHHYFSLIHSDIAHVFNSIKNSKIIDTHLNPAQPEVANAQLHRGAKVIMVALAHKVVTLILAPGGVALLLYVLLWRAVQAMTPKNSRLVHTPVERGKTNRE